MKKAILLFAVFVGPWFISHNAVAYKLNIDSLMYDISCAHNETPNPYDNKGAFTGFAGEHFWNGGYEFDLMGNDLTYQYDNFRFKVNAQLLENYGLDGMSNANPVPEPATMFLFGFGLVFLSASGRRLKKRISVDRNKSSPGGYPEHH